MEIDLRKVHSEIKDVSLGFSEGGRWTNAAKKDKEVLIKDYIPSAYKFDHAILWAA